MKVVSEQYNHAEDYQKISDFLIQHYLPGNADGNWLEPTWEYAIFHPALDSDHMGQWRIWEVNTDIVAFAHYEWRLGEGFFEFAPEFRYLREEMLDYAEKHLLGFSDKEGKKFIFAYVNDSDDPLLDLLTKRGYQRKSDENRPLYRFEIPEHFPEIILPDDFRLTSLAEDCVGRMSTGLCGEVLTTLVSPRMGKVSYSVARRCLTPPKHDVT